MLRNTERHLDKGWLDKVITPLELFTAENIKHLILHLKLAGGILCVSWGKKQNKTKPQAISFHILAVMALI